MRRSWLAIGAALTSSVMVLSGCANTPVGGETTPAPAPSVDSPAPVESVTLQFTWWGADDRAAMYEEAVDLFEKAYPHITVNTSFASFPDYWTQRSTEAASRSLPDVMQTDLSYLGEYSANGHLLDLAPYVGDGTIDTSDFNPNLVASGAVNGVQVALPTGSNILGIVVNPEHLASAGVALDGDITWAQYNEAIAKISAAGVTNAEGDQVFGSGPYTGNIWNFLLWLTQRGSTAVNDQGELAFTAADIEAWLGQASQLVADGALVPLEKAAQFAPKSSIGANVAAFEIQYDNFLAQFVNESGNEALELRPMPVADSGEPKLFSKPSMFLSGSSNSSHPKEAAMLIDFLLTEPAVGAIFGTSKGVPASAAQRGAVKAEEGSPTAKILAFEALVADRVTQGAPVLPNHSSLERKWIELHEQYSYGQIDAATFASQWFDEAELLAAS